MSFLNKSRAFVTAAHVSAHFADRRISLPDIEEQSTAEDQIDDPGADRPCQLSTVKPLTAVLALSSSFRASSSMTGLTSQLITATEPIYPTSKNKACTPSDAAFHPCLRGSWLSLGLLKATLDLCNGTRGRSCALSVRRRETETGA